MLSKLQGYRTIAFNGLLALVPTTLLVLEHLEQVDLTTLGVTPERVVVYTLLIKLANIGLRAITTTPVGQKS